MLNPRAVEQAGGGMPAPLLAVLASTSGVHGRSFDRLTGPPRAPCAVRSPAALARIWAVKTPVRKWAALARSALFGDGVWSSVRVAPSTWLLSSGLRIGVVGV